jgi:hypothetical protein
MTFHCARAAIGDVDPTDSNQLNMHNFYKLTYIPICVRGATRCRDALHDSGSQVNLIKRELLRQLPDYSATHAARGQDRYTHHYNLPELLASH